MTDAATAARPAPPAPTAPERRRVLAASFVGTAIEWYDFFLYGAAAALVFAPQFFPGENAVAGQLSAFATFAVGFIARPIGGVLMGHFGDRIGRKSMLVLSMLIMGLATVFIGLLPNFAAIGVWAPILLVALRFAQGIGVGGEWGGAVLLAVEYAPKRSRAFYGAFPQLGLPAGIILSNLVFIAVTAIFTPAFFADWGWRIPFLLSGLLVLVGLWLRRRVDETPAFREVRSDAGRSRSPIGELLRHHWRPVLLGGIACVACPAIGYLYAVYLISYGVTVLGLPQPTMLWLIVGGAVIHLVTVYIGAVLSDRLGQKRVFAIGAAVVVLVSFPFWLLVDTAEPALILLAFLLILTGQSLMAGPQAALIAGLFPTRVRFSGASLSYQIGSIAGGGFAPLIAASLFASFGSTIPISIYLAALGALSLVAVLLLDVGRHADD